MNHKFDEMTTSLYSGGKCQLNMKANSLFLTPALLLAAVSTGLCQPVITTQPSSLTNIAGTTATFSVDATGAEALHYQWQFNTLERTDQTNAVLVLTNVQTGNAGSYSVVITNVDGAVTSALATLTALTPPKIAFLSLSGKAATSSDNSHLYRSNSVSPGADLIFTTSASGTTPLHYQWQFNQIDLPGKTGTSLALTNVQLTNAGQYAIVVTNDAGAASKVATLTFDPTFTKITTGPIVTDVGYSAGGTWGDFNNDGFLDLFVFNGMDGNAYVPFLYRNNGDGTFTKVTSGPPVNVAAESTSACWGDYDNDGNLDLYATTTGLNLLYHNNGNGTFTRITIGSVVTDFANSGGGAWVDYDNDGFLDLFVPTIASSTSVHSFLYRNNGDGTFSTITNSTLVTDLGSFFGGAWGDYDNDGNLDLFVVGNSDFGFRQPNRLYHNNGDGTFTRVTTGSIATDVANSEVCTWGDYDNDGFLDLFVGNSTGQKNFLYHNNGDSTFTRITNDIVANDAGKAFGCAWGDYDNDGWLDLYVGNEGNTGNVPTVVNFLYHNNGDGTFTKVTTGSPVNEYSDSWGVTWADYDNDGFLDLFASRGDGRGNYLYRNNGNSNNWLTVKLIGTVSNRSAIGAKVRAKATIGGVSRWQLRQITGGSDFSGHNELQANFGLEDATNVELLRIEWPSGIVQTLTNVAPKQILNVVEHQQPGAVTAPGFTSVSRATNGAVYLSVAGDAGLLYLFEGSTNLVNWSRLGVRTNATGAIQFTDLRATNYAKRFYRVSIP
jgi:hypothetical protein